MRIMDEKKYNPFATSPLRNIIASSPVGSCDNLKSLIQTSHVFTYFINDAA